MRETRCRRSARQRGANAYFAARTSSADRYGLIEIRDRMSFAQASPHGLRRGQRALRVYFLLWCSMLVSLSSLGSMVAVSVPEPPLTMSRARSLALMGSLPGA